MHSSVVLVMTINVHSHPSSVVMMAIIALHLSLLLMSPAFPEEEVER